MLLFTLKPNEECRMTFEFQAAHYNNIEIEVLITLYGIEAMCPTGTEQIVLLHK